MVGKAFVVLVNMIGICNVAILQESRAPKSVLCAMEANPTNIFIQIQGVIALWSLGSCHNTLKREIVQAGGIQMISKVMGNFIASEQMQEKGILALWILSSSVTLEPAVNTRAIEAVADGISAHISSVKICEHGLGALSSLVGSKSVVEDSDNVIGLVFSCLWLHYESAPSCQGALAALSKLTVDQPTNRVLQITPDELDAVINAMRFHQTIKGVQENSIILLRSWTFCPFNLTVLGQNPYVAELVKSARSIFHGSMQVNGEDLLRLLPPANQ